MNSVLELSISPLVERVFPPGVIIFASFPAQVFIQAIIALIVRDF